MNLKELTPAKIEHVAGTTGYAQSSLEQALRLLELLQDIADNDYLAQRLALTGGTALNLFHLGGSRLSVDIDLNYLIDRNTRELDTRDARAESELQGIFTAHGYSSRFRPNRYSLGMWHLRYKTSQGTPRSLTVDANVASRGPLFSIERLNSVPLGDVIVRNIPVLDRHEVIAGKFVALIARNRSRDLFDACQVLQLTNLNWAWIKAGVLALGATNRVDWRTMSFAGKQFDPMETRNKFSDLLPRHTRLVEMQEIKDWIEESTESCREKVEYLLDYTDNELKFLDGILDHGTIDAGLLDVEPAVRHQINEMPLLVLKTRFKKRNA